MPANLLNLYGQEFASTVQLLLQQRQSRLRSAVMTGTHVGKQASPVDQVGAVEMQPVTSRFATKVRTDAPVDRRWVFPSDFDLQQLVDTFDKLKIISDPQSVYVQNAISAANRQYDRLIIDAFFDDAKTGETAGTTTSFLAGNVVGVGVGGTASNLNVAKLKRARKLLLGHEVDLDSDSIYCAITASQDEALLNEIQVISDDFNRSDAPVLRDGKLERFLGINFIHTELLETGTDDAAGTSRAVPIWAKSGVHLGLWKDSTTSVRQAMEFKGNPYEVYLYMSAGATRTEEKKVIKVWCRES